MSSLLDGFEALSVEQQRATIELVESMPPDLAHTVIVGVVQDFTRAVIAIAKADFDVEKMPPEEQANMQSILQAMHIHRLARMGMAAAGEK